MSTNEAEIICEGLQTENAILIVEDAHEALL
jgi:hypothetical protein